MGRAVIVSGLGRCGTSLAMQILHAGGVRCLGDPPAFEDDRSWPSNGLIKPTLLDDAAGGAVKILDPHIALIPPSDNELFAVWLSRDTRQQALSQIKFMRHFGSSTPTDRRYRRHLEAKLRRETDSAVGALVRATSFVAKTTFERLLTGEWFDVLAAAARWLRVPYDEASARAAVVPREPGCLDHLLETHLPERYR